MDHENLTPIHTGALGVLVNVTAAGVAGYPMAKQIKIYQALENALPDGEQKSRAGELARVLSRADALQLEFRENVAGEI